MSDETPDFRISARSLFTWWESERTRNLSFRLSTDRAEILKSGVSSDITAFYKGAAINGDLIAYRFFVWNAGREPIRWADDVLKEIIVRPADGMKLLEAKVIRATREEIGFSVANRTADSNDLVLKWKILERGDGALIQVLATNATSPPFHITGTVVGQGGLDIVSVEANDRDKLIRRLFGDKSPYFLAFLVCVMVSLGVSYLLALATLRLIGKVAPSFVSTLWRSKRKSFAFVCLILATYVSLCTLAITLAVFPTVFLRPPSLLLGS